MSDNIPNHRDHFKAIAVNTQGTPTQKLLAILADVGITDTAELVEVTGLTARAIQLAKRSTLREAGFAAKPISAKPISPDAKPASLEAKPVSPSKKVSPTPPSKNNTTTTTIRHNAARDEGRTDGDFAECKAAFNGSTDALLTIIETAMGGHCRPNAAQWLASLIRINGEEAVRQAYQRFLTARGEGKIIARPLPWLDITAKDCKREAKAAPASPDVAAIAALTAGAIKHARPAPGSARMPELANA